MTSPKNIVNMNYWLFPDKPLTLVKFIIVCENGETSCGLRLSCPFQQVIFDNVTYIVGEKLTFTVPMFIYDNEKRLHKVESPKKCDIVVESINAQPIPITIIKSVSTKLYYIMISITEDLFKECDLILYFTKFNLHLREVCHDCCEHDCKDKDKCKGKDKCDTICETNSDSWNDRKCNHKCDNKCQDKCRHKCDCDCDSRCSVDAWRWYAGASM